MLKSYLEIFTFLTFRETNFKDKKDINIDLKDENESNDPKYDIEHDPLTADIKKIQEKVPWMQFIDRETIVLCGMFCFCISPSLSPLPFFSIVGIFMFSP